MYVSILIVRKKEAFQLYISLMCLPHWIDFIYGPSRSYFIIKRILTSNNWIFFSSPGISKTSLGLYPISKFISPFISHQWHEWWLESGMLCQQQRKPPAFTPHATPRWLCLSPFFLRFISIQSFSNALSPLPPSLQPPPAFQSSWLAWDLLPHLFSRTPFLGIWVPSPSFLLPWLRRISLLCFWGNSQLHCTFSNKNPYFVSPKSWSWPEKLDWIGHSAVWTLFVIFGYSLFPVVYTDMSDFPQWSCNIPIPPYAYLGTHPAKFRMLLGSCIKRVLGVKMTWTKFLQDHNSAPGYDRN